MRQLTAWNNTQYGTEKGKGDRTQNGTWHSVAQEISFENTVCTVHSWPEYITCNIKLDKELRTGKDLELDRTHNLRDGMGLKIAQDKRSRD
jgi:hypothetical protein